MNVQRAIFPGIILGIFLLISLVNVLTSGFRPRVMAVQSAAQPQDSQQVAGLIPAGAEQTSGCNISSSFPQSIQQWCGLIQQYASRNGLDPNLVSAVMLQESAGQPDAYSKSGAVGLMQIMPRDGKASGFMCVNGPCFADRPSTQELLDPEYNIAYGTQMLSGLVQRHGNLRDALKSYGPMDVGYYYADLVLNIFNQNQ